MIRSRYTRKVRRHEVVSYCDEVTDNTRGICANCLEDNFAVKLEKYFMPDGRPDTHFLKCHNCGKIWDKRRTKYSSIITALGNTGNSGEPSFEVASRRRGRQFSRQDSDVFKIEDYPLAGKIDPDLAYLSNEGIVLSVTDDADSYLEDQ